MLTYLTRKEYAEVTRSILGEHWDDGHPKVGWDYHTRAVGIVKCLNISCPSQVPEIGTMGVSLVAGSGTLDYDRWGSFPGRSLT